MANYYNDSTRNINSKIYRWDVNLFSFVEIQTIQTNGARDWESFTIGTDTYLAVANSYNDSTYNIDSVVYKTDDIPNADAGDNRIVYDSVILDGSGSFDVDGGHIVSWEWALVHQTSPGYNRTATGETVTVEDLAPGFYTVTLTVTDDDSWTDTDDMILAAIGCKGDFDGNGDVDGSDLAAFAANFGRTDCPVCE